MRITDRTNYIVIDQGASLYLRVVDIREKAKIDV